MNEPPGFPRHIWIPHGTPLAVYDNGQIFRDGYEYLTPFERGLEKVAGVTDDDGQALLDRIERLEQRNRELEQAMEKFAQRVDTEFGEVAKRL